MTKQVVRDIQDIYYTVCPVGTLEIVSLTHYPGLTQPEDLTGA